MFIMVLKGLLGWDWEQSSLVLNTPTKKVRDSFASCMIKEDNRVGSCIGDLYLIPEPYNVTKTNTSLVIQLTKRQYLCCRRNSQEELKAASHDATC